MGSSFNFDFCFFSDAKCDFMLCARSVLDQIRNNDPSLTMLLVSRETFPEYPRGLNDFITSLSANNTVTCLRVRDDSSDVLFSLADILHVNTRIEDLVIESDALCDNTCVALAEAVRANKALRRLHLDCMAKGSISDIAGTSMASALGANSTLRVFNILGSSCAIGDPTGKAMAQAMARHESLHT